MTVCTDTGLVGQEQVVGGGTMGNVAVAAVLRDGSVLVDPGSRLGLMTFRALRSLGTQSDLARLVRSVTVRATEHSLSDWMMGGQVQTAGNLGVTTNAEARIRSCLRKNVPRVVRRDSNVEGLAIVGIVAVGTEEIRSLMLRQLPCQETPVPSLVTA
jgi:hypothetical protein